MVSRLDLVIGVRAWLLAAGRAGGLENAQVVHADDPNGIRPPPPFATVRVSVFQNYISRPERFAIDNNGVKQSIVRTQCRDTLSVNTYGEGAEAWLSRAAQFLWQPAILRQLELAGLDVEADFGGATNLSEILDDHWETRFQQDFAVTYAQVSDPEAVVEATVIETTHNIGGGGTFTAP